MRTLVCLALLCLQVSLLGACAPGSGEGLDANGRPLGENPDAGDEPTLANIQARVFSAICIQCHIGAAAPQGLRLDAANSFNDLVGVPSQQVGGLLRVNPFNPDVSYLVQKIEGSAAVGGQMPLGGPPLPAEDILLIRQWILEGAMPTAASTSGVAKVASTSMRSVQAGSGTATTILSIEFDRNLDASTVHQGSVTLTRSDDDIFGNEDDTTVNNFKIGMSSFNTRAVEVQLQVRDMDSSWYRLALGTSPSARILDLSGQTVEPYQMEFR